MAKLLDEWGVSHFWQNIKKYITEHSYTAGKGVIVENNEISVELPTVYLTQDEYDSLTNEQKNENVLYVTPSDMTITGVSIEEYDTEDGWHVRKWSNGYVEQTLTRTRTILSTEWTDFGTVKLVDPIFKDDDANPLFPVPMVENYSRVGNVRSSVQVLSNGSVSRRVVILTVEGQFTEESMLLNADNYSIIRPTAIGDTYTVTVDSIYTGRWK